MLIEVVSNKSSSIDNRSIQGRPKKEKLTRSNPILTVSSGKYMVGGEALEVAEHGIANPRSLGGPCLKPRPEQVRVL